MFFSKQTPSSDRAADRSVVVYEETIRRGGCVGLINVYIFLTVGVGHPRDDHERLPVAERDRLSRRSTGAGKGEGERGLFVGEINCYES